MEITAPSKYSRPACERDKAVWKYFGGYWVMRSDGGWMDGRGLGWVGTRGKRSGRG